MRIIAKKDSGTPDKNMLMVSKLLSLGIVLWPMQAGLRHKMLKGTSLKTVSWELTGRYLTL
jgi:hypothetical protein